MKEKEKTFTEGVENSTQVPQDEIFNPLKQ